MARRSTALPLLAIIASIASAAAEDPFAFAAYPVKWRGSADSPVAAEDPFAVAAYPVKWRGSADSPVAAEEPTFKAHEPAEMPAHHGGRLHVQRGMLFLGKNLYQGSPLPRGTRLAGTAPMAMQFASRSQADGVPFSLNKMDQILTMFKVVPGSERANQIAATLHTCQGISSPDSHTCATSQQAEAEFAAEILGTVNPRRVVTVVHGADNEPEQYTVARISRIGGADQLVACHPMAYPYMVRYCHRPAEVEALIVQLTGIDFGGAGATAVAICHKNTDTWDQRYFNMLNADRGEEICHFMPQNYVLWLKISLTIKLRSIHLLVMYRLYKYEQTIDKLRDKKNCRICGYAELEEDLHAVNSVTHSSSCFDVLRFASHIPFKELSKQKSRMGWRYVEHASTATIHRHHLLCSHTVVGDDGCTISAAPRSGGGTYNCGADRVLTPTSSVPGTSLEDDSYGAYDTLLHSKTSFSWKYYSGRLFMVSISSSKPHSHM
ncbi:hypothetical protein EJB05_02459 [Eragrostis curvula]|uniref:BURP domain-containing protein n=1 Tax=Eragrostis curvula TaxID=38414 RepID=A0A5J9WV37_9POAL|nr:hypothetical protein EJB05_02459 [Eragrostis curvula]